SLAEPTACLHLVFFQRAHTPSPAVNWTPMVRPRAPYSAARLPAGRAQPAASALFASSTGTATTPQNQPSTSAQTDWTNPNASPFAFEMTRAIVGLPNPNPRARPRESIPSSLTSRPPRPTSLPS